MSKEPIDFVKEAYFTILDEIFNTHHGVILDENTSLFETLAGVTAEQASIPVNGQCATLAAQVDHVRFYLDVLAEYIIEQKGRPVDWGEIWRTRGPVTLDEWSEILRTLRTSYEMTIKVLKSETTWQQENGISGALAILAHTTYHLGEIRQALCFLRSS
jgi:hypothetical protein